MNPEETTEDPLRAISAWSKKMNDSYNRLTSFYQNKKPRKITNPRTILIEQLMAELDFPPTDFKRIFGQTSKMTEDEIREMWQKARAWKKNSKGFFWNMVKAKRKEIKEQLHGNK